MLYFTEAQQWDDICLYVLGEHERKINKCINLIPPLPCYTVKDSFTPVLMLKNMHRSAITLKPLACEMKNIYHLKTA